MKAGVLCQGSAKQQKGEGRRPALFLLFGLWSAAVLCSAALVSLFPPFLSRISEAKQEKETRDENNSGRAKHCRTPESNHRWLRLLIDYPQRP
jgi:hypothetical protein